MTNQEFKNALNKLNDERTEIVNDLEKIAARKAELEKEILEGYADINARIADAHKTLDDMLAYIESLK